jgi:CHAT domain-containing protein
VLEVARTLGADPAKDVYLEQRAVESAVLKADLSRRRVVMFATHGLVPGDIEGLDQPALALTSPAMAKGAGDGLLTLDEILGLKLDADWVVLSACNTAAGNGAGAEAVSGLGRGFFFAGTRALLVSNWPVETTAARRLMTTLFRIQAAQPELGKAQALRLAMVSLVDREAAEDPVTHQAVYSYAHPLFWAPFVLVGD